MICVSPKPINIRAERGIALVLVLWVIALLTVMALGLTTVQRTESALTRNQIDGARFRALADAAINLAVLDLITVPVDAMGDTEEAAVWVPDGTPRVIEFDGEEIELRLYNESSRIDLNTATRDQLAVLIEQAQGEDGYDELERDQLADAIIDWRDPDDLVQLNGAEDGEYDAAGLPYGARDEPFRSVDELRQVLGMNRRLYQRLAPDLTVNNPGGRVDPQFASASVLAAIQGISVEDAQLLVEQRSQPGLSGAAPAPSLGGPLYRLRITLVQRDATRRTMEALVQAQRGAAAPVEVLWRRFGLLDQPDSGEELHTD